jgi:superfamily II DNA/RNA helicase
MTFTHLGLSQKTLDAISAAGFTTPTPIQAQAIPLANEGHDVVGIAQTGTGKTASFVLPMLTKLESGRARARMPRSLILEPTRELAAQVEQAFDQLGINHGLKVALLIGGTSLDEQFKKLDRGADVLIATPGRLLDHFGRGKILLSGVEILVIDEADRMLDMGFIPDIEKICGMLPPVRQTLFFSATMPKEVKKLADKFLRNPQRIEASPPASTASTITQRLKFAPADVKFKREALRDLLNSEPVKNAIIFCNRKRDVAILHRSLVKHGYNAGALHGDMEQRERMATLDAFRKGDITLLAASDVAARGLDIPAVSHIFNFDVPVTPEDYVHRIGRTGRAGREGYAATLVTPLDMEAVRAIEKLSQQTIEWLGGEPSAEDIEEGRRAAKAARRARPRRGSETGAERRGPRRSDERPRKSASDDRPRKSASDERPRKSASDERPRKAASDDRRRARPSRHAENGASPMMVEEAQPAPVREARAQPHRSETRNGAPDEAAPRKPRRERPAGRGRGGAHEPEVLGMGDHMPAFLMNPIRRAK